MKQTAVEFLVKEISDILGVIKIEPIKDLLLVDAINKAKEMEKKQIETAYNKAVPFKYGKEYYEETFNK
jgi:hypothetical protein